MAYDDLDYAPVGVYDDEEELRRNGGYAPAVPPPVAPSAAAPPVAAPAPTPRVGSLEDLEARAAQPRVPPVMTPEAPRPQWKDYAPAEPHGWGKVGHFLAGLTGPTNYFFNQRPQEEAATRYNRATAEYEAPIAERQKEALTEHEQSQAELERQQAANLRNPQPKQGLTNEETTLHDLMTGDNGKPRINPDTGKPYQYLEAFTKTEEAKQGAKPAKTPNDFEQFYADWLKDNSFPDTAHNRLIARKQFAAAGQPPQREQQQLAVAPDGTVVELRPGQKVPAGTKTLGAEMKGPTADEQRRADLAENMNENLTQLEDILTRRPDLFGPVAGRVTGLRNMVGTSDADVAALKTIEEQMGMAMVGAHAMRNAGHVATAAQAITNSFHNSPEAVKHAIDTARKSIATFQQDAGEKPGSTAKTEGKGGEKTEKKEAPEGTRIQVGDQIQVKRNGKWVPERQ